MNQKKKDKKPVQQILLPKYLLLTGKILNHTSASLATKFASKLFLKPFRYKLPKREQEMDEKSIQKTFTLPNSGKEIRVYSFGTSEKKILLVHGWSGRGTQLAVIAENLLQNGYSTISFDAPGHGKAAGKSSMMPYFIEGIQFIDQKYGPFEAVIGHSLGGMSSLKAASGNLRINKLIVIGTANSITKITQEFVQNLQMNVAIAKRMKAHFDKIFGEDMDNYSGAVSAKGVKVPTLVIHDTEDIDVDVSSAYEIHEVLPEGELFITSGLGHRKILGDELVIEKIIKFLEK